VGALPVPGARLSLAQIRDIARRLNGANELNPDPNMSMVVATAALLGLLSGTGQKIYIDMFGANAYANWDDFLSYPGKPERTPVDAAGYGLGALQRLYACKTGWVMLMIVSDAELARLSNALGRILDRNDPGLAAQLEAVFADATADEWEARLAPYGLGCVRADGFMPHDFPLQDRHARTEELVTPAVHPEWGHYLRCGPVTRFGRGLALGGAPAQGNASISLLRELGYSDAAIDALLVKKVVVAQ
jgi:crotonobetainyl-CoA:carnitine CoA-transferase CaiB-like acyl-CoA transferase